MAGYVYILSNDRNTVLYTGVTSDLSRRLEQHKTKAVSGFARKYNLDKLVYFEECPSIIDAIAREKQIKAGSRRKKIDLIEFLNPDWEDLMMQNE